MIKARYLERTFMGSYYVDCNVISRNDDGTYTISYDDHITNSVRTLTTSSEYIEFANQDYLFDYKGKKIAGLHIIIDMYGLKATNEEIVNAMKMAAKNAGATTLNLFEREFDPVGFTAALILSESHITVHTWPEREYAAFDIFLCANTDPMEAAATLTRELKCAYYNQQVITRGVFINDPVYQ